MSDERRAAKRAPGIPGSVVVLAPSGTGTFTVQNISASGAMLTGDLAFAPKERVKLLLHLEGHRSFGVTAEVLRTESLAADRYEVAVVFLEMSADVDERVRAIIAAALGKQQIAAESAVLVVDNDRQALATVERDLHGSGRKILFASTPLEVVGRLQDPSVRFEAALVELSLTRANVSGVLSHLSDDHPRVRRILMCRDAAPELYASELTSGRAHVFLRRPWERQALLDVLSVWLP